MKENCLFLFDGKCQLRKKFDCDGCKTYVDNGKANSLTSSDKEKRDMLEKLRIILNMSYNADAPLNVTYDKIVEILKAYGFNQR